MYCCLSCYCNYFNVLFAFCLDSGLSAGPERKVLQSYGEFSYRANFLRLFFVLPPFSDFLKIYSEEYLLFPISAPALFSELSRLAAVALRRPFLKSECKGRHSPHSLQIFQKLFYTQSTLMIVRETFKRLYRIQLQAPRIFTVFSNNFYANIFFTVKAKEMRQITEPAKPTETANNAPHDHHPKTSHTTRIRQKHIYINIKFRPLKKKISPEISHLKRKPIY